MKPSFKKLGLAFGTAAAALTFSGVGNAQNLAAPSHSGAKTAVTQGGTGISVSDEVKAAAQIALYNEGYNSLNFESAAKDSAYQAGYGYYLTYTAKKEGQRASRIIARCDSEYGNGFKCGIVASATLPASPFPAVTVDKSKDVSGEIKTMAEIALFKNGYNNTRFEGAANDSAYKTGFGFYLTYTAKKPGEAAHTVILRCDSDYAEGFKCSIVASAVIPAAPLAAGHVAKGKDVSDEVKTMAEIALFNNGYNNTRFDAATTDSTYQPGYGYYLTYDAKKSAHTPTKKIILRCDAPNAAGFKCSIAAPKP